ncbi:ATP-binding protein [Bradyrhizobium sp. SZCCHNR2011]|nr:ATP-binding protein [Bradyrhizobium sp. SZCCHNR2011]
MKPADPDPVSSPSSPEGRAAAQRSPRIAERGKLSYPAIIASVLAAALSTALVELVTGLRQDRITSLLMLAVAAVMVMIVLTSMLIRKNRHALSLAHVLARQNAQLAQTTRLLNDAQRIGRLGHWMSDETGEFAVWSEELFDIFGLAPTSRVSFVKILEIVHPEDVGTYVRARDRSRATGCAFIQELRIIRPDGQVRWLRIEADANDASAEATQSRFGIVQDITERKLAEIAAEQARLLLMDAIESLTNGFVLFDKDDRFVMSNTTFREMFPSWTVLMRPGVSFSDLMRQAYDHGLIRSKGDRFEEWLERKRAWHLGGSRMIERRELNGRWIQSVDHRISDGGTVCLVTDITAFKTVQAELEQKLAYVEAIRSDLERQKQELEATGAELRAARDAAEAANRAKSDFLAIMSHEIRTPLSGMVGMVDLLRGTSLTGEQKRYTALAKESADLLLEVINDILDFSKLEAGRLQSECIDFDVPNLIQSAVSFMGEKARKRGLDLAVTLAPGLPQYLEGDPTRIRQVLLNLVGNAIKFTEQGSIQVRASHRLRADGAIDLTIEVIDSGIGMSPEIQAQIFDPFVQADTSISRKYGGSGLGLAICKQLCTIMGGSIGVDSELGRGSRFWFEAKCRQGDALVLPAEPVVSAIDRPLEILVAEDSPIIATLIHSLLVKQGFKPTRVVNGAEAVAAVSARPYDIILMDVQMPEMDGISATRAIRQLPGPQSHVPIIALTANALVGQREAYLAAGMNDYVTKPIQPPLLFAAIRRCALPQYADAPPLQPGSLGQLEMFVS